MIQKENIQQEIEKTLQSLDGLQRAEANPFLFTRIKAKMQKEDNIWERTFSFISRPIVAVAILVFVMAVNAWAVLGSESNTNITSAADNTANVSELATEYNTVASANNYDYINFNQ